MTVSSLPPQLPDSDIQDYHDTYRLRMDEMHAFNMVGPSSAPGRLFLLVDLSAVEKTNCKSLIHYFQPQQPVKTQRCV